jgi:hypothetical protein
MRRNERVKEKRMGRNMERRRQGDECKNKEEERKNREREE